MSEYFYEKVNYKNHSNIYLVYGKAGNMDMHIHDEMEILCVLSGDMYVLVNHNKYHLHTDDMIVINEFEPHGTLFGDEECTHIVLQFKPFEIFAGIDFIKCRTCEGYHIQQGSQIHSRLHSTMQNLFKTYIGASPARALAASGHLSLMFADIIELLPWSNAGQADPDKSEANIILFRKVIQYMCDHYDFPLTLEEVASVTGFSVYHFCRFFKRMSGMTFLEYLTELRVNKSVILLCTENTKIGDIASLCGFTSIKTFNRVFKNAHGMSPGEYRKRYCK